MDKTLEEIDRYQKDCNNLNRCIAQAVKLFAKKYAFDKKEVENESVYIKSEVICAVFGRLTARCFRDTGFSRKEFILEMSNIYDDLMMD